MVQARPAAPGKAAHSQASSTSSPPQSLLDQVAPGVDQPGAQAALDGPLHGLTIGFAGTPEFAAVALAALLQAGARVPLVLTQPDRPAGRGLKLQASPVKQLALQHGIAVAQPRSLRLDGKYPDDARAAQAAMQTAACDAWVVAAYGLILPRWVLDLAANTAGTARNTPDSGAEVSSEAHAVASVATKGFGCLNIHASLLPRWRGAAPIHRAIEAGDAHTGITIMQMDEGLDTGDMLLRGSLPIGPDDTTASLHDRLAALGGELIVQTLVQAAQGTLQATPQPAEGITYAHKIDKAEALIDWSQPAEVIARRVNAFNPAPGASTTLNGESIKVWGCAVIPPDAPPPNAAPIDSSSSDLAAIENYQTDSKLFNTNGGSGVVLSNHLDGPVVRTGHGLLRLTHLQRAGGKRLTAAQFLPGCPMPVGSVLGAPTPAADADPVAPGALSGNGLATDPSA